MKKNTILAIVLLLLVSLLSLTACSALPDSDDSPKTTEVVGDSNENPEEEIENPSDSKPEEEVENKPVEAGTTGKTEVKNPVESGTTGKPEVTTSPVSSTTKQETTPVNDPATTEAGVFSNQSGRPVLSASSSFEANKSKLNEYLKKVSGYQFVFDGIASPTDEQPMVAQLILNDDGRYGLHVFSWRTSKASNAAINQRINAVLEAIYFITGDKQVALSVWNLIDGVYINGTANTKDQGFDQIRSEGNTYVFGKNGFEVEWEDGDTYVVWLSKAKN